MIPTHLFVFQHLAHSAIVSPTSIAVEDSSLQVTYRDLHYDALHTARRLSEANILPGDRVLLIMDNSIDFARAYWGILYAGAVVVPLTPDIKHDKLLWIIEDCTPKALVIDAVHLPLAKEASVARLNATTPEILMLGKLLVTSQAEAAPLKINGLIDQDLGCIIYTSGSTGVPKGVMLSHQNLVTASRSVCTYLGYRSTDRIFVTIPLTFDYGMHQLTMGALVGATVMIERNFSKPLYSLHRAAKNKATVLPIVPTMVPLIDAIADRFDLSSVRIISSTAAALHSSHIARLAELFPEAQIFSMYGLTECHRCTYLPPSDLEKKPGSVGIAIPNTTLWVVDTNGKMQTRNATGELVIRGATVMKGYWNRPDQTARKLKPGLFDGEFVLFTGDLCRLDADGYLYFLSRSDDILKIKGEKVAPKEIEDTLLLHPAVSEAAVLGRPDEVLGQRICALVTLKPEAKASPEMLREWCALYLEPIAVPQTVEIREAFARNSNGKIDRLILAGTLA